MGCSGSKVAPLQVYSSSGSRTADRTPSRQPGTVNGEHNDASNFNEGESTVKNKQDENNGRENFSERSIRVSVGAQRPAVDPEQRSVEVALAADERQARAAKKNYTQASGDDGRAETVEQGRRVQTIVAHPSSSKQRAPHSPDHSNSDRSLVASYVATRGNVAPLTVDEKRGNNRNSVAASDRNVCDQNTSTTDLQPNHAVREKFREVVEKVVYVDRVVEVPQVSDRDIVVQVSQYLEHALKENFGATGEGLGQLLRNAKYNEKPLPEDIYNCMEKIVRQRNKIIHNPRCKHLTKKPKFLNQFKAAWESLQRLSSCDKNCDIYNDVSQFISRL